MSKPIKLLVLLFIVALLAAVVLTMFGKSPNLPLGPLQGVLAKDEEPIDEGGGGSDVATPNANPCPPGQILGVTPNATSGAGTTGTGTGATAGTDAGAAAGTGTDAAGTGAAGAGAAAATPNDPATGAPTAVPTGAAMVGVSDRSWNGKARILAAGDGGSDRVSDTMMVVDAVPTATDPAVAGAAGTGTAATPAAGTDATAGAAGAGAAATDPAAGAAAATATPNCIPDPAAGAGTGTTTPTTPGAGAATTPGAGTPSTPGAGAKPAANVSTTDGTNMGNSPEALRMAQDITSVMQQAKITVAVTATLVPAAGGAAPATAQKFYRSRVTGAVLVIKLTDQTAVQQWTAAGKAVQAQLVKSFIQRLGKTYPKAMRSISVVDSSGNLLAVGDAGVGGGANAGAIKLY